MELRQVRYFLTVVDAGSISEGARRLHISQPPLSLAMRQLEEELEAQLFVRGHSHLTLTEAGRSFYQKGQNLVELASQTTREIREMRRERTLHLGVTPTTVPLVMPALQAVRNQDSSIRIDLHDGSTYQLLDLVARRLVDAAVIRTPCSAGNLHQVAIARDSMLFLSPDGQEKGPVCLEELSRFPLILYRRYRDFILDVFSHHAVEPKLVGECDDARTAISMVRASLGCAIIPSTMGDAAAGTIARQVEAPELATEILFVWDRDLPLVQEMKEQLLCMSEAKEQ